MERKLRVGFRYGRLYGDADVLVIQDAAGLRWWPRALAPAECFEDVTRAFKKDDRMEKAKSKFAPEQWVRKGQEWILNAGSCVPYAPVVTDAMKLLCWPGNRVRVAQYPVDQDGIPYATNVEDRLGSGMCGTVVDFCTVSQEKRCGVRIRIKLDGTENPLWVWVWNLEPAEEK